MIQALKTWTPKLPETEIERHTKTKVNISTLKR